MKHHARQHILQSFWCHFVFALWTEWPAATLRSSSQRWTDLDGRPLFLAPATTASKDTHILCPCNQLQTCFPPKITQNGLLGLHSCIPMQFWATCESSSQSITPVPRPWTCTKPRHFPLLDPSCHHAPCVLVNQIVLRTPLQFFFKSAPSHVNVIETPSWNQFLQSHDWPLWAAILCYMSKGSHTPSL